MKLLFNLFRLLTIFSFIFVSCDVSENTPNNSSFKYLNKKIVNVNYNNVPDSIKTLYKKYAGTLALRELHNDAKLKETLVTIPNEYIELFYNLLILIYQATNIPARQAVVEDYAIPVFPSPETDLIIIGVDTTFTWVKKWKNDSLLTGNIAVDSLTTNYLLSFYGFYDWPWSVSFVLQTARPVNILALCQRFKSIAGVKEVYPDGIIGGGSNIDASITDNYVQLDYSYGFGDCPSGCISRHFWHFRVYYTGTVEYIGESGDSL